MFGLVKWHLEGEVGLKLSKTGQVLSIDNEKEYAPLVHERWSFNTLSG